MMAEEHRSACAKQLSDLAGVGTADREPEEEDSSPLLAQPLRSGPCLLVHTGPVSLGSTT